MFIKLGKQGSTLAGVMDAFSIAISVGLQYGIPLESYVAEVHQPALRAGGHDGRPGRADRHQSVMDYLFRRLALDYLPFESARRAGHLLRRGAQGAGRGDLRLGRGRPGGSALGRRARQHPAPADRGQPRAGGGAGSTELLELHLGKAADAPLCLTCGTKMRPAGSCYLCEGCGSTSGCS